MFHSGRNFFWTPAFSGRTCRWDTLREVFLLKSQAVAQYLPFLRRYARALTGSQASGDAYVSATLEALIEDPAVIEDIGGQKVAFYRLFTKIWN